MNPDPKPAVDFTVESVNHDRNFAGEPLDSRRYRTQFEVSGQLETEVLILGEATKFTRRRLQDSIRRYAPGGTAPSSMLFEKRNLGLRSSETELADRSPRSSWYTLFTYSLQFFGNFLLGQPFDSALP
jgi:hypothetical protein